MKALVSTALFVALSPFALLRAEIPAAIQSQLTGEAEKYDGAMKEYDEKCALLVKLDRDRYLLVLNAARKREEGAKRTKAVAAIDAELKGVDAGSLPEKPPADLPAQLAGYRTRYQSAPERAAKAVDGVRRFTRESYLKWLSGMANVARRGKSKELEAAVANEVKRVRASEAEGEADEEEADESESPSDA